MAWRYVLTGAEVVPWPCHLDAVKQKMTKRKPPGAAVAGQQRSRTGAAQDDGVMRWVERKSLLSPGTEPPGTEPPEPERGLKARRRGRLNGSVLAVLGKGLEDCFDEVRKQEVPERFKLLLQQF